MRNYIRIPTSPEVWAVIRARHGKDLHVFSSYSAPGGDYLSGNMEQGVMETAYGFAASDTPILEARTTWDIDPVTETRSNERHEYWLCAHVHEEEAT